jgi:hypothetical protein
MKRELLCFRAIKKSIAHLLAQGRGRFDVIKVLKGQTACHKNWRAGQKWGDT